MLFRGDTRRESRCAEVMSRERCNGAIPTVAARLCGLGIFPFTSDAQPCIIDIKCYDCRVLGGDFRDDSHFNAFETVFAGCNEDLNVHSEKFMTGKNMDTGSSLV